MAHFIQQLADKIKGAISRSSTQDGIDVKEKFERFKKVLECNQKALEIIADMGEKLSGDYLFDRHYIETSFDELSETVLKCVHRLNTLCENRYKDLYEIYERIYDRLLQVLKGRDDRHGPPVILLHEINKSQFPIIGGKALHLARIINDLEFPVPKGFVITTRAYHDIIFFNGLEDSLERLERLLGSHSATDEEIEKLRAMLERSIMTLRPTRQLLEEIELALSHLADAGQEVRRFAIRSSAREEDMDFSFAGQFKTVLNVKGSAMEIFDAYKTVIASLFSKHVIEYRRTVLEGEGQMSIAAICQVMIDAKSSGVLYTTDPLNAASDNMVIVGNWGQGEAVVDGKMPADSFLLSKKDGLKIIDKEIADKTEALYLADKGGLERRTLPKQLQHRACLTDEQLLELARMGIKLENYFKHPQDVEWALDPDDRLLILQSRALLIKRDSGIDRSLLDLEKKYTVISSGEGLTAQQGIGYGPVKIVKNIRQIDDIPDGAVLVSPRDSSVFVRAMKKVSAIVTEVGTPVSHMATICRELGVPCLVNVTGILSKLKDGMEVTVDAEERKIYKGKVKELLVYRSCQSMNVFASSDFRLLRRLLNEIARLNLIDPLIEEFRMDRCETYHDILRFIHEKAVQELIELGKDEKKLLKGHLTKRLELSIPTGILCLDLGGGVSEDAPEDYCEFQHIVSIPFRALLKGMLTPGVWHTEIMDISLRDMVTSMINAPKDAIDGQYSGHNVAIITKEYMNLSLRFGYHFNIVDAYCSDYPRDNHIYFRFLGGATDITKRSRRARLIAEILRAYDMNVKTKGDVVTARMGNMPRQEMERVLEILGRLIGFTRQLDVHMESDSSIQLYLDAFLTENYEVVRS